MTGPRNDPPGDRGDDQGVNRPGGRPSDPQTHPERPPAGAGGVETSQPTMPGPSGAAKSTELVGDPGAGSPATGAEAGAAAGTVAGVAALGPLGAVVAAPVGALAGAAAAHGDDEPPPASVAPIVPGARGVGPTDPIYDVARIQRRMAERAPLADRERRA
ncbi:MAG TPA: hypothetical protein VFI28_12265 [Candidatus Limnocylindrales bacterium]|nr:hypothetical protein [Candidatus Limnocylindrales bacterium]